MTTLPTQPHLSVIPITSLAQSLLNPTGATPTEEITKNVAFYANWFPDETRAAFDQAHKDLADKNELASSGLMILESHFIPDSSRFVRWFSARLELWKKTEQKTLGLKPLKEIIELSDLWKQKGDITTFSAVKDQLAGVRHLIHRSSTSTIANWSDTFLVDQINSYFVPEPPTSQGAKNILTEDFFKQSPEKVIEKTKEHNIYFAKLDKPEAKLFFEFLTHHFEALTILDPYQTYLSLLLVQQPSFVLDFLDFVDKNLDKVKFAKFLKPTYSSLLHHSLVPEERKIKFYLDLISLDITDKELIKKWSSSIENILQYEKKLVREYIRSRLYITKSLPGILADIAQQCALKVFKKLGPQETEKFLLEIAAEKNSSISLSLSLIHLLIFKNKEAATQWLSELIGHPRSQSDVDLDLLFEELWKLFCIRNIAIQLARPSWLSTKWDFYQYALKSIPVLMHDIGMDKQLKDFYLQHHPYQKILNLPPHLKPSQPVKYVNIDFFPDPQKKSHPDKNNVAILGNQQDRWLDEDTTSHGFLVSSLALGKTFGLAPHADLAIIPMGTYNDTISFAERVESALKTTIDAAHNDPHIRLVGMSLGLEVPNQFRDIVHTSALYKKIMGHCDELHQMGVEIFISSGNDENPSLVNTLSFLPHITLVGALSGGLMGGTEVKESSYTTAGDKEMPIKLWAHADPVLCPVGENWIWLDKGGTSSAQGHLAGALLMVLAANTQLSAADGIALLERTAKEIPGKSGPIKAIDPSKALLEAAFLPGSTYSLQDREELELLLGDGKKQS